MTLFEFLCEVNRRPEPFVEYTAPDLWTDPHTSVQMLAYHLDETVETASRNPKFLDRSVHWIMSHFRLTPGAEVADFGCGPGLYAERLAREGVSVTGIDFSANSLRHARETACRQGLDIEYIHADYLDFETSRRFDLILMIMCDLCALNPGQRAALLRKFRSMLAANGKLLFDIYSPRMFDEREETTVYAPNLMDGFWSPEAYFGFLSTFKYEEKRLLLDKYTIVERDRTRRIYNWLQCFAPQEIENELVDCGLHIMEYWGDVSGNAYDPDATAFAVVANVLADENGTGQDRRTMHPASA